MRICLIGNSGLHKHGKNGQTLKVNIYKSILEEEGNEVVFVDLEFFNRSFLKILFDIKINIKHCDRIVLISGERGCRFLIPYINFFNKKYNRPIVLPLIGSGILHKSIDSLSDQEMFDFYTKNDYSLGVRNNRIAYNLSKIKYILPETQLLCNIYSGFYKINNCFLMNNFRKQCIFQNAVFRSNDSFKIIFISRIVRKKGIFDLLCSFNEICNKYIVTLDVYGDFNLTNQDRLLMNQMLNSHIMIHSALPYDDVIPTLVQYDLLVFPTRFVYEGTPGIITESLISGTPILTSNFPNAPYLLKDGYDSIFYEMFNVDDLKNKLEWCINNKDKIRDMRKNCLESSKRFTYEYNRKDFLKYVCGVEEK